MDSSDHYVDEFENPGNHFEFLVEKKYVGVRLDQFLALHLPEFSRSQIAAAIKDKEFLVSGVHKKNSYKLKLGEQITGTIVEDVPLEIAAEKIDFPILYEDEWLLFLSKPPGLVVHPGSGNKSGTLVNGLVHYCQSIIGVGDAVRPGIVHRLDKDTSGVMVVAKTEAVHRSLVNCFKDHQLEKEYLTLVRGVPSEYEGRIVASIGRHPVQRQKMSVKEVGGKYAASNWELVELYEGGLSLLRVKIETGRTHQIRVHMAHLGFPVAGDSVYGNAKHSDEFPRQMLHAARLVLHHPVTGRKMDVRAPLWEDFDGIVSGLIPLEDDF